MNYPNLNPQKALIWRITHRKNIPWILAKGLHAGSGAKQFSSWVTIGNEDLINRRSRRQVPLQPGGVLNDYIPFYFTPFSPMMYNIHTGKAGVKRLQNSDIIILVSSMHKVVDCRLSFLFTDRHAYAMAANYYRNISELSLIDWPLLQQRDFQRDPNDPEKVERYQAEALIYKHMPVHALIGAVCYSTDVQNEMQKEADRLRLNLNIQCMPHWYF